MEPIRVKRPGMRDLYVLVVLEPGSRERVALRRTSRRPLPIPNPGEEVRVRGGMLVVTEVRSRVERREGVTEHVTELCTRAPATNVVRMPVGDDSVVAQFLRYHVLVRVFDGDPDAWLAQLEARGGDGGDLRFVRWIRTRLRQDPALMVSIRKMVDATPFWRVAEA